MKGFAWEQYNYIIVGENTIINRKYGTPTENEKVLKPPQIRRITTQTQSIGRTSNSQREGHQFKSR